jgi:hypothetical protein
MKKDHSNDSFWSRLASINLYMTVKHFHLAGLKILLVHRRQVESYPHYDQMAAMARIVRLNGLTTDDPYILVSQMARLLRIRIQFAL